MFNKKERLEEIREVATLSFYSRDEVKQFLISEEDFIKAVLKEDSGHIKDIHFTEKTIIVDWYRSSK